MKETASTDIRRATAPSFSADGRAVALLMNKTGMPQVWRVPAEYLRYEDEGHGLIKLANRLDAYPKMADFLDRYLRSAC